LNFETIIFELQENGIGILTLNRPDKLNAVSYQMVEELNELTDHLMTNLDCRVLIFKAEGKIFSAGTDLKDGNMLGLRKTYEEYKKFYYMDVPEVVKKRLYFQNRISDIFIKMRKISQPIICLIQGPAAGAGFCFALASDVRIATPKASFINAVINLGLAGIDVGNSYFLPRLIGMSRAAEFFYFGKKVDAEKALHYGLITKIVDENELFDAGLELAEVFLQKSPLGLRMTKEAINLTMDSPSLETMVQYENRTQAALGLSKDLDKGASAFLQKRKPKYGLR
jgi:enoyl-CoA hydratase/carnithine racemase